MLLTIITGALSTTVFGLPLWAGVIRCSSETSSVASSWRCTPPGTQMGVPQMLQTRAQFGSYGSLLVVVLVVFMYLGFFASNAVLGGKALASVTGMPQSCDLSDRGVSVAATMIGYKLIHGLAAFLLSRRRRRLIVALVWMVWVNGLPGEPSHQRLHSRRVHGHDLRRRAVANRLRAICL